MTIEHSHSGDYSTRPRIGDLSAVAAEPERSDNHDALGRFTPRNNAPAGRAVKVMLKRQLGKDATEENVQRLYRDTRTLFLAELAKMPDRSPAVQRDLASRARWSALSAWYATRAAELGLDSPAGLALIDVSLKCDARAERLGITALAISERLAKVKPKKASDFPWLLPAKGSAAPTPANTSDAPDASQGDSEPLEAVE
jgi:hypothetical protein